MYGPKAQRHTVVDLFIGGPWDGKRTQIEPDMDRVRVGKLVGDQVMYNPRGMFSPQPCEFTYYERLRFGTESFKSVETIRFWVHEGLSPVDALLKLCLGYKPSEVEVECQS